MHPGPDIDGIVKYSNTFSLQYRIVRRGGGDEKSGFSPVPAMSIPMSMSRREVYYRSRSRFIRSEKKIHDQTWLDRLDRLDRGRTDRHTDSTVQYDHFEPLYNSVLLHLYLYTVDSTSLSPMRVAVSESGNQFDYFSLPCSHTYTRTLDTSVTYRPDP